MGNVEGGHSRSPAHSTSATDSPRHQSRSHKLKSPASHSVSSQQKISRNPTGKTVFYDMHDDSDADADKFHTCKPGIAVTDSTRSKDIPSYYFTASQLARAKNLSKSHDANLNRVSSVSQKTDVRHIAWSTLVRKSNGDAELVSVICFLSLFYHLYSHAREPYNVVKKTSRHPITCSTLDLAANCLSLM